MGSGEIQKILELKGVKTKGVKDISHTQSKNYDDIFRSSSMSANTGFKLFNLIAFAVAIQEREVVITSSFLFRSNDFVGACLETVSF